jgi:hypothetical protein
MRKGSKGHDAAVGIATIKGGSRTLGVIAIPAGHKYPRGIKERSDEAISQNIRGILKIASLQPMHSLRSWAGPRSQ